MVRRTAKRVKIDTKINFNMVGYLLIYVVLVCILTLITDSCLIGVFGGMFLCVGKEMLDFFRCGRVNNIKIMFGFIGSMIGAVIGLIISTFVVG